VSGVLTQAPSMLVLTACRMPILNGFQATERVREIEGKVAAEGQPESHRQSIQLNGRIPIFAVSATLKEEIRERMVGYGLDGWVLKPVDFKRLSRLLEGITETETRVKDLWAMGHDWERGGWLTEPAVQQRDFAAE
jgi:CheY-like chemotaxis protein